MKKIIIYLSLFLLSVSSVHAVTITNPTDVPGSALFNFQVIQADEGVLTTPYDSRVGSTAQITNATATSNNGMTPAFAYLDGPSGGPGGLGVCKVLNAGQCSPSAMTTLQWVSRYFLSSVKQFLSEIFTFVMVIMARYSKVKFQYQLTMDYS